MRDIKLKICGMREGENILQVAAAGPDLMGFVFYGQSPRYVWPRFRLPDAFPNPIQKVGVFVNATAQHIVDVVLRHRLDYAQLHGDESPGCCRALKEEGIKVIKAFSVDDGFDFEQVNPYQENVDYVLFDTRGAGRGGNGVPFDWALLEKYKGNVPFFLSGGISPGNIGRVRGLRHNLLFAIDVNSGIENSPGTKDMAKLNELISNFNDSI